MVDSIEESTHTSAFDRVKGAKGQKVDSAAFDLVPVDREEQAKKLREIPVEELRREKRTKKRNPTGKRIRRDEWLAPLTLGAKDAADPESSASGVRARIKVFCISSCRSIYVYCAGRPSKALV